VTTSLPRIEAGFFCPRPCHCLEPVSWRSLEYCCGLKRFFYLDLASCLGAALVKLSFT